MCQEVIISQETPKEWDNLLLKHKSAHIYNSAEYAKIMSCAFGFKPLFFYNTEAMLLGFEQNLRGAASKIGKGFVAFAPPVFFSKESFEEIVKAVEIECKKRGIVSLTIWSSTLWDDPAFFDGFERVKMQNVVATLGKSEEELFNSLEHSARKNLSKSKEICELVSEGNLADLDDYYSHYAAHHKSIGLEVYPKSFFEALFEHIISKDLGKFFVIRDKAGVFAGGLMISTFGKSIYELSVSSNWEKRHLFPNDVLKWHAMKWANSNKFLQFDLSNIAVDAKEGSKEFNVNRFKKKFGEVKEYNSYKKKFGLAKIISRLKK